MPKPRPEPAATAPHLLAGRAAEADAARWLAARGVVVLARNVRVPGGEIDLLARQGACLLFVEVRWRRNARYGGAAASIDWRKRRRLQHAALWLLQREQARQAAAPAGADLLSGRLDALCRDGDSPDGWCWLQGI